MCLEKLALLAILFFLQPATSTILALSLSLIIVTATACLSFLPVYLDPIEGAVDRVSRYGALCVNGNRTLLGAVTLRPCCFPS